MLGRKDEGVARDEVGDNDLTRMPKVANVNEHIVNPERSFGSNIMEQVLSTSYDSAVEESTQCQLCSYWVCPSE